VTNHLTPAEIAKVAESPRFAVLTRTDAGLSTLATWDPALSRDVRLLVPIDVQALVAAPGAGQQGVPTETVVPITTDQDSVTAAKPTPPAPFGAAVNRSLGVHLHWAMPDGLTRGDAGAARNTLVAAGNPTGLPPLPDRWVVVRLAHGQTTPKCWVLEADRGDHHDLAGWVEPGPLPAATTRGAAGRRVIPQERLTAVAGGDLAWAATYDAVIDRFAFHDDLADLDPLHNPGLELSYLVAGWWSDPTLDPLADCTSVGAYHDRLRWLGWLAPEGEGLAAAIADRTAQQTRRAQVNLASPSPSQPAELVGEVMLRRPDLLTELSQVVAARGPAMPRLTLLHGSLFGVTLSASPDRAPAAGAIQVAVGPTAYAALSALLAEGADAARASSERVLAAFASGLLSTIDAPGGLAAVDEDRHASAFRGIPGGTRDRPDRIAEGDVMVVDREAPATDTPTAAPVTGAPATRSAGTVQVKLVKKSKYQVRESSSQRRFGAAAPPRTPRTYRDIVVPNPRWFVPADLAFVLRGAARSQRHGGDGRFTEAGQLACRLPSQVVRGYRGLVLGGQLPEGLRSVGSGAVPPEVDLLLREAVLTDPYRWREIVGWITDATGLSGAPVENRLKAELALRRVRADSRGMRPELDDSAGDVLRRASLEEGSDASPVGVRSWAQPWVPLWCDWEIELRVDDRTDRWVLGPIDLETAPGNAPAAPAPLTVRSRTLLVSATARALAAQIGQWLSDEKARDEAGKSQVSDAVQGELAAAAAAAAGLDVLTGTFAGIRETLLGLDPQEASMVLINPDGSLKNKPRPRGLPLLLAGGTAQITRLRVVDGFGRWRDIPTAGLNAMEIATANRDPAGAPTLLLPARLQRPARLALRFVDPRPADGAPDVEARIDQQHPDEAVSPVAGWLLPDHVDEGLEVFDATGTPLGQLMHDELTGGVVWEGAPGRPGPIGGPPDPGDDPGARHLTRFAAGVVEADAAARNDPTGAPKESALSALLRAIDTTLWTVDPLGSLGTGAVAGLVGRPIAVVRAIMRLDVASDVDELDFDNNAAARAARVQAYADLAVRALSVRLGELTRTDDSLLAYAVDDDYHQLLLVAPEVRTQARASGRMQGQLGVYARGSQATPGVVAIDHPYLNGPNSVTLRAGQTVRLTLLMAPGGRVHVTSGVLPRKSLALARDWFHDALVRLSPSFRLGPVLVDPDIVRLPMITGLGDKQAFTRRDTPLTWRDDPIVAATQTAYLPDLPSTLEEGWIRIQQEPPGGPAGGGAS